MQLYAILWSFLKRRFGLQQRRQVCSDDCPTERSLREKGTCSSHRQNGEQFYGTTNKKQSKWGTTLRYNKQETGKMGNFTVQQASNRQNGEQLYGTTNKKQARGGTLPYNKQETGKMGNNFTVQQTGNRQNGEGKKQANSHTKNQWSFLKKKSLLLIISIMIK